MLFCIDINYYNFLLKMPLLYKTICFYTIFSYMAKKGIIINEVDKNESGKL